MFGQKINTFQELPIEDVERKKTDIICTIIGAIYALTLFILAFVLMNKDNYIKTNFPTDSDNIPCGYGINSNYQFVYFPNINDISTRVCLNHCPNAGDPQLICRPNNKVASCAIPNIYTATINFGRLGGFCAPVDQAAQQKLRKTANLQSKQNFLEIFDSIKFGLLISIGIGIIWIILVQLAPRFTVNLVSILSILTLGAIGFIFLFDNSGIQIFWKMLIGITLILIAVLFVFFLCFYRKRNKLISIFLDWSTKYYKERILYIGFIFLFLFFTSGLIALCLFQHLAFLTNHTPVAKDNDIYLDSTMNVALFILNLLEFIWGLQFLKDSFNFVISGLATRWYCQKDNNACATFKILLVNHFGSIVGGSFMNTFFNIINFFLETLRCYPDGACAACTPCCQAILGCCANIMDLVRTDVYAYINLTGITYCNAARNCELLNQKSKLFVGSQSILYFYRISAYCFTVGVAFLATYYIQKGKIGYVNLYSMLFVLILSYCIINYFVDFHANKAQGIQICFLIEKSLSGGRQAITNDDFGFKNEIKIAEDFQKDGKFC